MNNVLLRLKLLFKGEKPLEYILYKLFWKSHIAYIIKKIYIKIFFKRKNRVDSTVTLLKIETYDGYNQATHPDAVWFKNNLYLIVTPYPYSNEVYENPCVYKFVDDKTLFACSANPIASLTDIGCRHHFSDPAFIAMDNLLYAYYRECVHQNEIRTDKIYRLESSDGENWGNRTEIFHEGNSCIAPSFLDINGDYYVYYVVDKETDTFLIRCLVKNDKFLSPENIEIKNEPEGFTIWHVDIKKYNDIFVGLFDYNDLKNHKGTRLFLAISKNGINWEIKNQIVLGKNTNVKNLYKATSYIDNKGKLCAIISALDSHQRWFLYRIYLSQF